MSIPGLPGKTAADLMSSALAIATAIGGTVPGTPRILTNADKGPMRVYIGNLHYSITEDMMRPLFEPFGRIEHVTLMRDSSTGTHMGYGFVTYRCNLSFLFFSFLYFSSLLFFTFGIYLILLEFAAFCYFHCAFVFPIVIYFRF